jgi:hypothetical protein
MGIDKQVPYGNTGIVLSYWRINFVGVDMEENSTRVRVGGYMSKSDALSGKRAVDSVHLTFSGPNNPISYTTDPRTYQDLLYAKIVAEGSPFTTNKLTGGSIDV